MKKSFFVKRRKKMYWATFFFCQVMTFFYQATTFFGEGQIFLLSDKFFLSDERLFLSSDKFFLSLKPYKWKIMTLLSLRKPYFSKVQFCRDPVNGSTVQICQWNQLNPNILDTSVTRALHMKALFEPLRPIDCVFWRL